jgi:hypothetical protein
MEKLTKKELLLKLRELQDSISESQPDPGEIVPDDEESEKEHEELEEPKKEPQKVKVEAPGKNIEAEIPDISMREFKKDLKWPATMLFVGKRFSGKTSLLLTLLKDQKKKFDNLFVITVSKHTGNLAKLVDDEENIFEPSEFDDNVIEWLLDFQVENPKAKTLLVFDDCIDGKNAPSKLKMLATSGRNFNISMIFCTQVLRGQGAMDPALRKNVDYLFCGRNFMSSCQQLAEEYSNVDLDMKQLKREILKIKDHGWLVYNEKKAQWYRMPESEITVHAR